MQGNLATSQARARQQLRAWTGGHADGARPSKVRRPVLMVATDDTFFSQPLLQENVKRFSEGRMAHIAAAGHWAHVEQPQALGSAIRAFLAGLT